ncbi:MAG TPA: hypothetical protein VFF60_12785 [Candidatus Binatus sp.]|nr:hypothetical protein [Candidatus Binatus sp.]
MLRAQPTFKPSRTGLERPALQTLAPPLLVLGLEWAVSASNKILGGFVGQFGGYVNGLVRSGTFLPGLHLFARFPTEAAYVAIGTEAAMAVLLIAAAIALWRGMDRFWVPIAEATTLVSAVVATTLWLMLGHQPFWPSRASNGGFGPGIGIEFFLAMLSLALVISTGLLRRAFRHRHQQEQA